MLVLTRKVGESIFIGDDIKLKIIEIRGKHVRIAIQAPREVPVNREEVYLERQAEKQGKYKKDEEE